ncbi:hypothetical protein BGX38DRAFT_1219317 [Terfezia claveryi]|nr:hypothetical protein BGX38DRAFT_1219317 [Terfezia claveryi]
MTTSLQAQYIPAPVLSLSPPSNCYFHYPTLIFSTLHLILVLNPIPLPYHPTFLWTPSNLPPARHAFPSSPKWSQNSHVPSLVVPVAVLSAAPPPFPPPLFHHLLPLAALSVDWTCLRARRSRIRHLANTPSMKTLTKAIATPLPTAYPARPFIVLILRTRAIERPYIERWALDVDLNTSRGVAKAAGKKVGMYIVWWS